MTGEAERNLDTAEARPRGFAPRPLTAAALVLVRMLYVEGAEGGGTIEDAPGAGGEAA